MTIVEKIWADWGAYGDQLIIVAVGNGQIKRRFIFKYDWLHFDEEASGTNLTQEGRKKELEEIAAKVIDQFFNSGSEIEGISSPFTVQSCQIIR